MLFLIFFIQIIFLLMFALDIEQLAMQASIGLWIDIIGIGIQIIGWFIVAYLGIYYLSSERKLKLYDELRSLKRKMEDTLAIKAGAYVLFISSNLEYLKIDNKELFSYSDTFRELLT